MVTLVKVLWVIRLVRVLLMLIVRTVDPSSGVRPTWWKSCKVFLNNPPAMCKILVSVGRCGGR